MKNIIRPARFSWIRATDTLYGYLYPCLGKYIEFLCLMAVKNRLSQSRFFYIYDVNMDC